MSPVAMSLEELIPSNQSKSHMYAILIRTALVISTLLVGLTVPFFGLVMALIGSLLTMLVTLILPCACFLSILRGKITRFQGSLCILIIAVGVVSSAFGTYSALAKIIEKLSWSCFENFPSIPLLLSRCWMLFFMHLVMFNFICIC